MSRLDTEDTEKGIEALFRAQILGRLRERGPRSGTLRHAIEQVLRQAERERQASINYARYMNDRS